MELGEGEAQICRLCGQYERIYIDVFSEDGVKRLLGLKIHSQINILIEENDGLPQVVCLRCMGALEFLCDFYDRCQLTQMKLTEEAKKNSEKGFDSENDAESNKENALPIEAKRKTKALPPDSPKYAKDSTSESPSGRAVLQENALDSKKQKSGDASVQEQRSKNKETNNAKPGKPMTEKDVSNQLNRASSETLNNYIISIKDSNVQLVKRRGRKRGRKSKLEKLREAGLLLNVKREQQKDSHETRGDGRQRKRQCLRAICTDNRSNLTNGKTLSKSQLEPTENKLAYSSRHAKTNVNNVTDMEDVKGIDRSPEKTDKPPEGKEEKIVKGKAISVIVKQEKVESEASQESGKANQLVWIPNEILARGRDLMLDRDQEIEQDTSLSHLEDDTVNSDDTDDKQPGTPAETRGTVIRSSQTEVVDSEESRKNLEVVIKSDLNDVKSDTECEFPVSKRLGKSGNFDGNKSRDRSFGKISDLISDEQKETIETYYTIDMSIVNSEEVQKNITVVDKKNMRCNICGSLYLRMDKCQVHVWGHLQMKPYQCKACDFATVTVSNVRCHIRKSHLKIKPFACNLCEKKYVTAVLLEEHMNTHTGARPFKCKLCDFASSSRQVLSYHSATHKPVKDISCKTCGKEFYSRGKLRAHMIIHNKDKVVMCKLCSAYLSNAEALETHHKNLHTQDYVCNICGKRVKSKKALHNHQNVHSAAKYKCTLCPNVYKSSQILKEHLLKHEGIRKYKCGVCEKAFGQQSHLAAHMAVHSKIRFHCPGCNKAFNRHDNMKIHTKRCKPFLENPELKDLLVKKERTSSVSKLTELSDDVASRDSLNFESFAEKQAEQSSIKTVDDKEKTAMKLGLNISCIKSSDKTWTRDDVFKEMGEITEPHEISVIEITDVNDKVVSKNDNLMVLENVLGPESF
ncbi:uncharacterized protein LOC116432080 [Nomia melanderi]|uniref:uncharacterized protein LOC116432080 n=1 Tax=Nomia melanderi TaxID=2448451 RepID=UPI0013043C05|nr:zinc finger protein 624-like [Nomia melanderi]